MDTEEFVQFIKQNKWNSCLYHVTDESSRDSIKSHGILSTDERTRQNIEPSCRGGNPDSHKADEKNDVDSFVCLSFTRNHPVHSWGNLLKPLCLEICPEILLCDGVIFTDGVANSNDVPRMPIAEAIEKEKINCKIIYEYNDWKDEEIQEKLQLAEKTEILVPKCVPQNMIIWDI